VAAYRLFEFPSGLTSVSYGIDVFAYLVWGIAAIAVAFGLLGLDGRTARATAAAFGIGGILAVMGGVGFVLQSDALELGVLLSGVTALVATIMAALLLHRNATAGSSLVGGVSFEVRLGATHP
jgi:hypothetical protein